MKKRVLITGASGFIGSILTRRLLSEGNDVSIFLKRDSNTWRINDILDKVLIHVVDLSNPETVEKAVKLSNPEVIYHFAANQASPSIESAENDIQTNIIGTWNLLKS